MRRVWRRGLLALGGFLVVAMVGLGWLGSRMSPAPIELSDHHPFRSADAKRAYLAHYDRVAREWPVPSETRLVETPRGRTFVRVSGPAGAPPLVLLHGAYTTSLSWKDGIAALSADARVYAVDNIYDFGRSVYTRDLESGEDFAGWLDEVLGALELEGPVRIVGLSYGGWVTSQYALRHPERVDRIVLIAPAATVLPVTSAFLARGALAALIPHPYFPKSLLYWLLADAVEGGPATQRVVDERVSLMSLGLATFLPKLLVPPTVLSDEELAALDTPALFVIGENERIYAAEAALDRLRRVAPQIETVVVPDAGHDLTIVQADRVNRMVVDFLKRP